MDELALLRKSHVEKGESELRELRYADDELLLLI
jgi:hypothetical protein